MIPGLVFETNEVRAESLAARYFMQREFPKVEASGWSDQVGHRHYDLTPGASERVVVEATAQRWPN